MKVEARSKVKKFTLVPGGDEGTEELRIIGKNATQTATGLRWEAAEVIDRENTETTITFNVTRTFATMGAAETFMLRHDSDMPVAPDIYFTSEGEGGGQISVLYGAVVEVVDRRQTGGTIFISYSIKGGLIELPT